MSILIVLGALWIIGKIFKNIITNFVLVVVKSFSDGHLLLKSTASKLFGIPLTFLLFFLPVKSSSSSPLVSFASDISIYLVSVKWNFELLPVLIQAVQALTLSRMLSSLPSYQKMLANDIVFVLPESPKCRASKIQSCMPGGTKTLSSRKTIPKRVDIRLWNLVYSSGSISSFIYF